MKVITIRGLDSRSNIVINNTLRLADKYHFNDVTSVHLMYVLLDNKDISKMFLSNIGLEAQEYIDACNGMFTEVSSNWDGSEESLGIEDISDELSEVLKSSIERAISNNRVATIFDLYNSIIADDRTQFWEFAKLLGVDRNNIKMALESPLDDMPITSSFGTDYNVLAVKGKFDSIAARDDIIDNILEILGRRVKNNPCIVGESGVGKTAIVEGIAQRLVSGDVPWYLKGKHIISIDISKIVSGSKYRGDFEEKLNSMVGEVSSRDDVILFFDEFHMLAEAGGSSVESAMTASNILKPALSRGEVQLIGATTLSEYKKFIEKDRAFERRIEKVSVTEPSVDDAIKMVNAVIGKYEEFHEIKFNSNSIKSAVILSDRYITDKKLPDKAITVLDETAARVKKSNNKKRQVDIADVKETVSKISGIDINDLDDISRNKLLNLKAALNRVVVGQDKATEVVSKAIMRSKAGIKDPNRPIGSFLFVGPTGVGKTELSKALAIEIGGGTKGLIRFDMSEFMEKHSISKLIGSPPGYVGYGEGGQLTEAVRNNPYSIVLFDEIEKAHPDIFNILLQVLDDGILTDSEGLKVDFKNTVIIMTSNAGYSLENVVRSRIGFGDISNDKQTSDDETVLKSLENTFRPEFLNRIDKVVVFNQLNKEDAKEIAEIYMKKLKNRLKERGIHLQWDDSIIDEVVKSGFSTQYGARNINRTVQTMVADRLADLVISDEIKSGDDVQLAFTSELDIKISSGLYDTHREIKTEAESIVVKG